MRRNHVTRFICRWWMVLVVSGFIVGCSGESKSPDVGADDIGGVTDSGDVADESDVADASDVAEPSDVTDASDIAGDVWEPSEGFHKFVDEVEPLLAAECASCHMGDRFSFASIEVDEDGQPTGSRDNYDAFFSMISLDAPEESRLLAKIVPEADERWMPHGGGSLVDVGDETYETLLGWIELEKQERCPNCGLSAPRAWVGYIDQPAIHWGIRRQPERTDRGLRQDARIMLQPVDPQTMSPTGEAVDFLDGQFCGPDDWCDFGRIASNYAGDQLAFECRLDPDGERDWMELSWNICLAEIGEDGRAVNPRFLKDSEERHIGMSVARLNPFGLFDDDGTPLRGTWDRHVAQRKKNDLYPVYAPGDDRLVFSSRGRDPRTGIASTRTYHGFEHTNNIVSTRLDGSDGRTLYLNEGGTAESSTFLRNGNLTVHVWNLERMDRHLYIQTTADGMMELPVLFGRVQGPNMWGPIVELANGGLVGATGRRRGSVNLFQLFFADHTIGAGLEEGYDGFQIIDPDLDDEMDVHFAYCDDPPYGEHCSTSRFYADPSYSPDGRALITYNPERTFYASDVNKDLFWERYGGSEEAIEPYVPNLRVALMDMHGEVEELLTPAEGRSYRYPVWVGPRQPPMEQPRVTDESMETTELHIANFPIWLSMKERHEQNKATNFEFLQTIDAVRVLYKRLDGNACLNDDRPYRRTVWAGHDHPTHLGINNATGYVRLEVPQSQGGNAFGDVPLEDDGSVRLTVPAGRLLLFQGIDSDGHVVSQHSRVFALPPGHEIDTAVKETQYHQQCVSCHGTISNDEPYQGIEELGLLDGVMDFDTLAAANPPIDLTDEAVHEEMMTFLHQVRPMLDGDNSSQTDCTSCHGGDNPAGELTFDAEYSTTANAPKGRWAQAPLTNQAYLDYLDGIPDAEIVEGYNWSVTRDYLFDDSDYRDAFISDDDPYQPLGALSHWDPGYQALFLPMDDSSQLRYLTATPYPTAFGRGGRFSTTSFLLEVLSGQDLDPRQSFEGPDHTGYLDESELRRLMAVIDMGFPFMGSCTDRTVPEGPNAGEPWGDPVETDLK